MTKEKFRSSSYSRKKPSWNNSSEEVIIDDDGSEKLNVKTIRKPTYNNHKRSSSTNARKKPLGKNIYDDRPAFNLDTKIEGYDNVDENGRYKRYTQPQASLLSEAKKRQLHQEELNQQWTNSLRDKFHIQ